MDPGALAFTNNRAQHGRSQVVSFFSVQIIWLFQALTKATTKQ